MLTVILAIWTWIKEDRAWMRRLAVGAVVLVILQGVLGGLRVVWVSLNLAVVHTMVAQLFFALLAAMAVFVSLTWRNPDRGRFDAGKAGSLSPAILLAPLAVYVQIGLGALLRHPGVGIDPMLAGLHMGWAFVATAAVVVLWVRARSAFLVGSTGRRVASIMISILITQVSLGLFAYLVLLDESGALEPSNVQVVANTAHMVIGALLFASSVSLSVIAARYRSVSVR